ncbi:MAG: glutamate--tRNA ligase [Thermoplasmata archaeon]
MLVVRELARKFALQNALSHGGRAQTKAVMGKVLAADPDVRHRVSEVAETVSSVVEEVNALDPEEQRRLLQDLAPELLERPRETRREGLPDLADVSDVVVMRLAPYPSGPLHIGNARMVLLNDEYTKRYGGRLLLVHDDTIGSDEKLPLAEAYGQVEEGLRWLGVEVHEVLYKSDRLPLFYDWGRRLLDVGGAYVCLCSSPELRANRVAGRACEHRASETEENLRRWEEMLAGELAPGQAVVRLKTDMRHPNPAFRDRVLFRISDRSHPRVGTRYRVWPLLEFSWAVDDHLLGVTHVLRGKDLLMEDEMERAIWDYFGVDGPAFIHFGLLRLKEVDLSKSRQHRRIEAGELAGVDDPRTWSLQSLRRRGIQPGALRDFIKGFGLSLTDIEVPAETLYAENRRLIDPLANRYFLVPDPVAIRIEGLPERREAHPRLHPDFPERGTRTLPGAEEVYLARQDLEAHEGEEIRLKDWCNVRLVDGAKFLSWRVRDIPKVQWLPRGLPATVLMPDASEVEGLAEEAVGDLAEGTMLQFERFGFVRLEDPGPPVVAVYAHR